MYTIKLVKYAVIIKKINGWMLKYIKYTVKKFHSWNGY